MTLCCGLPCNLHASNHRIQHYHRIIRLIEMMIAIRIVMMMMMMIVMFIISNMMHLYYESAAGAVAVDRSATSSSMNRTRRSYR